jgi:WD40 repeat protein
LKGHDSNIFTVAYRSGGRRLAPWDAAGIVKIWDPVSGHDLVSLHGHTGSVYRAVFSPDGLLLATAGSDGSVRVWDAPPLEE